MPGAVLHELRALWVQRDRQDEYIGTLVNAWLQRGGDALGVRAGESYVDVGTLNGYREAMRLLGDAGDCAPRYRAGEARRRPTPFPELTMSDVKPRTEWTEERIRERVQALGPWFHNMELGGVRTAPEHFLGDYPMVKWQRFAAHIPADLTGKTVLDIGCNAGFYSMEMKRRGAARVHRRRFRRGLPRPGALRRRGGRARHRVPPALGL